MIRYACTAPSLIPKVTTLTDLSLSQQLLKLAEQLQKRILELDSSDPVKDSFTLELASLNRRPSAAETLEEANARLRALKQLSHLVVQHYVRLRNPEYDQPVGELPASLLTIEARVPRNVLETALQLRFSIEPSLLHEPTSENELFDPVSPTAKIVGYLRGLDKSLKITEQLSVETEGADLMRQLGIIDPETQACMAVLFQSRYHAMNAAIASDEQSMRQIIEFAAGISPRGYQWSKMSPGTIYVESDLPQLMIHKAKLIRNSILASDESRLGLLHCCAANALDEESVFEALGSLDVSKPFTLVTEGLLLYFGSEELNRFLSIVKVVLAKHPGSCWVTDLVSKENLQELLQSHPGVAAGVRKTFSLTGRQVIPDNPFDSEACIRDLLSQHGLSVASTVKLSDVTANLEFDVEIPETQRHAIVGQRKIWRIQCNA